MDKILDQFSFRKHSHMSSGESSILSIDIMFPLCDVILCQRRGGTVARLFEICIWNTIKSFFPEGHLAEGQVEFSYTAELLVIE